MSYCIHKAHTRGAAEHGWLSTRHSFSFASWYNPDRMGFGKLRVLNDDTIAAGSGFGTHQHDNMEIITIVLSGTVTHKDSMGNTGEVRAGEVQVMSAGTGVLHSEYNNSSEELHLFQLWIEPDTSQVTPRYDQRLFSYPSFGETLLVAPMGNTEALTIHQDAYISLLTLPPHDEQYVYNLRGKHHGVYCFVVEGNVTIHDQQLETNDAIGIEDEEQISFFSKHGATLLMIDVPM